MNPSIPHAINNLIIGEFGIEEILVVARDNGDVDSYLVRHIHDSLKRAQQNDLCKLTTNLKPFFQRNVGKSAWGIAVHKNARYIAVSSNNHDVHIFAFALVDDKMGGTALKWRRDVDITINIENGSANIPCISFCNTVDDNDGKWLFSTDINGTTVCYDLSNLELPQSIKIRPTDRDQRYDISCAGWIIQPLDPWMFKEVKTIESMDQSCDFLPGNIDETLPIWDVKDSFSDSHGILTETQRVERTTPLSQGDLARLDKMYGTIDISVSITNNNPSATGFSAASTRDAHSNDSTGPERTTTLTVNEYFADSSSVSEESGWNAEAEESAAANLWRVATDDMPNSGNVVSNSEVHHHQMNVDASNPHQETNEEVNGHMGVGMFQQIADLISSGSDEESDEEWDEDLDYMLDLSDDEFPIKKQPVRCELGNSRSLFPNLKVPLLYMSQKYIYMLQPSTSKSPKATDHFPIILYRHIWGRHFDESRSQLRDFERCALFTQIAQLGLIVVGNQNGHVAILSTIKAKKFTGMNFPDSVGLESVRGKWKWIYALRLEAMLPVFDQGHEDIRPRCPLIGLTVGPIQGSYDLPDDRKRWRLMLLYLSGTVLSYEISRTCITSDISISSMVI